MGELADALADTVWLTTDNPRREAPEAIAAMVRAGARGRAAWHEEPDRGAAIRAAVAWARANDVVVVAGRGPETHQQLFDTATPFSDSDAVRDALQRLG
jgi:UDP-N-acetylmuramyl tripeptide synthase